MNWTWLKKALPVLEGAAVAGLAAGLAWLGQWATGLDPAYSGLAAAAVAAALSALHRWAKAQGLEKADPQP